MWLVQDYISNIMQFYSVKDLGSHVNGIRIAAQDFILDNSTHKTVNKPRTANSAPLKIRMASKGSSHKKHGMHT